jgi:hypothetical protein
MDYSMLIGFHHIPCHHPSSTVHEDTMNARATAVMGLNFRDQTTRVMQRAQVDHLKSKQDSDKHLIVDVSPTENDGVEANIVDADKSNVESIPVDKYWIMNLIKLIIIRFIHK